MLWLETSIHHAPSAVAQDLAQRSARIARAVLASHPDAGLVDTLAAIAPLGVTATAQRVRTTGHALDACLPEAAASPHLDPDLLATLCTHHRPRVRLAAWTNPATPTAAVVDALGAHADDAIFNLTGSNAHSTLATRAAAVVAVHPAATPVLIRHPHGAVRSGAVALGDLDGSLDRSLPATTAATMGFLMNPTVPTHALGIDTPPARATLDTLLAGRSCAQAVATMSAGQARAGAALGAHHLDLALARRFPHILLEVAASRSLDNTTPYLSPVALAVACQSRPDLWPLALHGQSTSRVGLARAWSPRLDTARALAWHWRAESHPAALGCFSTIRRAIAAVLGDDVTAWELWGFLTRDLALDDAAPALARAEAAAGTLAPAASLTRA